jgi:uncharacterized protein involved in exopolysaccharide biosynthesis
MRGRYTDEHPDVVHLQTLIEQLRNEMGIPTGRTSELLPIDLARSIIDAQLEVSRLKQDEAHLRSQIEIYQKRVENAFVRSQELESVTRDYDVTQRKYQTLLDKKLEAQLSQSLEQRQKAERFRVIDPASLPQTPVRPNRPMSYGAGLHWSRLAIPAVTPRTDPAPPMAGRVHNLASVLASSNSTHQTCGAVSYSIVCGFSASAPFS